MELLFGEVFNSGGGGVLAQGYFGTRRVQYADGFVGQLASADVAVREAHRLGNSFVKYAYAEVLFHQGGQASQHGAGHLFAGLFHFDDLKAPRQCGIFLKILFVLAPGGGSQGAQLAAGQGRL